MTEAKPPTRSGAKSILTTPEKLPFDFAAIVGKIWPTTMEMADPEANIPHRPLYFHALGDPAKWDEQEYIVSTLPDYPGATYSRVLPKRLAHVDLHSIIVVFRQAKGIPDE